MNLFKMYLSKATAVIPDKLYLSIIYYIKHKKIINWSNPQTYTEKLQWIKVNDRKNEYTKIVDKYEMKEYIDSVVGKSISVPTLGIWNKVEDIDFDALPQSFVLKCTHDSGSVILCERKEDLDREKIKEKLRKCLKNNLYLLSREWPYKNVVPRIIAEEYLITPDKKALTEYKLFCFDGVVKLILVCAGKAGTHDRTNDFFDAEFNHLPLKLQYEGAKEEIKRPQEMDELLKIAEKLSKGLRHIRVDAYILDGKIYVGELTFFHNSGLRRFEPESWDKIIGEWLCVDEREY